jgi:polycystin 2
MDIEIVKLLKYNDGADYILMAVEVLFFLFVLYYLIEEGIEIKTHGMSYFMNVGKIYC